MSIFTSINIENILISLLGGILSFLGVLLSIKHSNFLFKKQQKHQELYKAKYLLYLFKQKLKIENENFDYIFFIFFNILNTMYLGKVILGFPQFEKNNINLDKEDIIFLASYDLLDIVYEADTLDLYQTKQLDIIFQKNNSKSLVSYRKQYIYDINNFEKFFNFQKNILNEKNFDEIFKIVFSDWNFNKISLKFYQKLNDDFSTITFDEWPQEDTVETDYYLLTELEIKQLKLKMIIFLINSIYGNPSAEDLTYELIDSNEINLEIKQLINFAKTYVGHPSNLNNFNSKCTLLKNYYDIVSTLEKITNSNNY
ncbi:hypothetical protein [Cetobacterium sp.]|uniref:hypothetical protein n=1 Tax=Cetobacterium sp. TaxID=2071632 RepID=UPI003EE44A81